MILLDIEGTTTPIAFVTQVLYPHARAHLRSYLDRHGNSAPYLALIPGGAIVVSVLGFNLIGDALREALDPRFRGRA